MARTTGSDHLYQLVHSLTTEEKGYFIKFAKRYSSSGNTNLLLFQAISKQKVFEEKTLQKKFKAYAVTKVYLRNMITDSLVLYHRSHHSHIELLSEIQKIHVLMMKGMQVESLKMVEKAIAEAEKMEIFALVRYLLQIKKSIQAITLNQPLLFQEMYQRYFAKLNEITSLEADLMEWEKISSDAFITLRNTDYFRPKQIKDKVEEIREKHASSKRSQLLKLYTLYYFYHIAMDEIEMFAASKNIANAASEFRLKTDGSYDDVSATYNYLGALREYLKVKECITESEKMFIQPRYNLTQKHRVLIAYVLNKCSALLHLGRSKEALQLLIDHEKSYHAAITFTGDTFSQGVFVEYKTLSFFLNRDYAGAWRTIQWAESNIDSNITNINYADFKIMEIMIQFMLGNFDLVTSMAVKYKRDFAARKVQSHTYEMLFKFFSTKSSLEYKKEAKKVLNELNAYYTSEKKYARKIFWTVEYTFWLEEIAGGRTMQKALAAFYAGN